MRINVEKMKFLQNAASRRRRSRPLPAHFYYNIKYNNNITQDVKDH